MSLENKKVVVSMKLQPFYFLYNFHTGEILDGNREVLVDLFYFEISLNEGDNLLNTLCCSSPIAFRMLKLFLSFESSPSKSVVK